MQGPALHLRETAGATDAGEVGGFRGLGGFGRRGPEGRSRKPQWATITGLEIPASRPRKFFRKVGACRPGRVARGRACSLRSASGDWHGEQAAGSNPSPSRRILPDRTQGANDVLASAGLLCPYKSRHRSAWRFSGPESPAKGCQMASAKPQDRLDRWLIAPGSRRGAALARSPRRVGAVASRQQGQVPVRCSRPK
jgi:hypothetical protein